MTSQMIQTITEDYYSRFCSIGLSNLKPGTYFVCSEARDEKLKGFGCKYPIYILANDVWCVAAYSPRYREWVEQQKLYGRDKMIAAISEKFKLKKKKLMLFEKEAVTRFGGAKVLSTAEYPLYESFFRKVSPGGNPSGWLYEYFTEKAAKGYFTGYLLSNKLVSVCDAPDMPYMEGQIQHTGISTLKEERRKGYAACTAALAVHHLIEMGICPQWECSAENIASIMLAKSIGYKEYGDAYIFEEWDG